MGPRLKLIVHKDEIIPEEFFVQIYVGWYTEDEDGRVLITPECTPEEIEDYIDQLKENLESIRQQVRKGYPY